MKAPPFRYMRARSCAHACDLLAQHSGEARLIAGGQSLMPILNMRLANPAILVDINSVGELAGISLADGVLRIGALTRHREVGESSLIRQHLRLITDAMQHVAHAAIRNRGTFGGSLATADPAAEMPACCLALDAEMVIESVRGRRTVHVDDFFRGTFETALEPDEILVAVEFPVPGPLWRHAFVELARRRGDFAIVGGAVQARVETRRMVEVRLVLFGVGDRPVRMRRAEQALVVSARLDEGIAAAQATLEKDLAPLSDNQASAATRLHLARVLLQRALLQFQPVMD
jgi:aerobic carbon-monoxide dehydrogenase medium subunit